MIRHCPDSGCGAVYWVDSYRVCMGQPPDRTSATGRRDAASVRAARRHGRGPALPRPLRPRRRSAGRWRALEAGLAEQRALRPELTFEAEPAPRKLAPFATAVGVTVAGPTSGTEVAWGRFMLLFDPDGQRGWGGPSRIIATPRRPGAGDRRRPDDRPGRLELADRGAGRPAAGYAAQRHRHPGGDRGLRRQAGRAGHHRVRATRLLVPGLAAARPADRPAARG